MGMGMYPPNMMGMNPNNINLNADSNSMPQGMSDLSSINNLSGMNGMNNYMNMPPGFNPMMFQGQNLPSNMNMQMGNNEEMNSQEEN